MGLYWQLNGGDTVDGNAAALHLVFKVVQRLVAVVSNGDVGGYFGTADDVGDDIRKITGPSDKKGLLGFPLGWGTNCVGWWRRNGECTGVVVALVAAPVEGVVFEASPVPLALDKPIVLHVPGLLQRGGCID